MLMLTKALFTALVENWMLVMVVAAVLVFLATFAVADCDLTLLRNTSVPAGSFKGQVVWVTGASSGIGKEAAIQWFKKGAQVILSARREKELQKVADACIEAAGKKAGDRQPLVVPFDMLDFKSHQTALDTILEQFGRVDIVFINAGRTQRSVAYKTDVEVTQSIIQLNLVSAIALARQCLPQFRAQKGGHFVVTSSVAGKVGSPVSSSYSASKWGLHGYFEAVRFEEADNGVEVTMVCPGPVATPIAKSAFSTGLTDAKGQVMVGSNGAEDQKSKMTVERCVKLTLAATRRRLPEVWVVEQPILTFVYLAQYCACLGRFFGKRIGPKRVAALENGGEINQVGSLLFWKSTPKKKE